MELDVLLINTQQYKVQSWVSEAIQGKRIASSRIPQLLEMKPSYIAREKREPGLVDMNFNNRIIRLILTKKGFAQKTFY